TEFHIRMIIETARALLERGLLARWCIAGLALSKLDAEVLAARLRQAVPADYLAFYSNVPHTEIPQLLERTRVGFVPLADELKFYRNIPMKLFEFLAAGKPAVVSDLPPARSILGDVDCCIFVPPGDSYGHADAIAQLLECPSRAREM